MYRDDRHARRAAGAVAAAVVGGGTLAASFRCGATLLAFYFSGSRLTAWMEERKATDDAFKAGGQRDWVQVRPRCTSRARSLSCVFWNRGLNIRRHAGTASPRRLPTLSLVALMLLEHGGELHHLIEAALPALRFCTSFRTRSSTAQPGSAAERCRAVCTQVLANALIPLLAALALVPVTGGADVPLAADTSLRVIRLLGAFLGENSTPRKRSLDHGAPCHVAAGRDARHK